MDNIENLVTMASNGDRSAFEELYRQTCRSVYFTCLSFLKNEQEAADVTQDVYLTVLEELPTLNDKSKFISWLNRIAVNKCKNVLAKKKPVLMDYDDIEYLQTEENENFLPEEYITNEAKRKIVMDIMKNSLSDVLYQTVIMYYFNDISVTEIAEIMGCPVGTVTYRLSVARARIKEGVLRYENKNDDKLYTFVGVPFLTSLLVAEMQGLEVPNILPGIIDTVSKGAVAAQIAKGGTKTIFHTLKSKIIAGIVAAALVGGGIAAVVVISNNDNEDNDNGIGIASEVDTDGSTSGTTMDINTQVDEETAQETTESIVKTESRWLLQQDFATGQLDKAPADFTLFNEQIVTPISIEDIKQSFNAEAILISGHEKKNASGTAEDVLNIDDYYFVNWENKPGEVFLYAKDADKFVAFTRIYNFSDKEISVKESVDNNWWTLYTELNIEAFFGFSEDNNQSNEEDTHKAIMEYLINKLGSPNFLHLGGTVEEFLENAEEENSREEYELGWVFDDYVLRAYCYDRWYYNENTFEIVYVEYLPREVWEQTGLGDRENNIEQLFK